PISANEVWIALMGYVPNCGQPSWELWLLLDRADGGVSGESRRDGWLPALVFHSFEKDLAGLIRTLAGDIDVHAHTQQAFDVEVDDSNGQKITFLERGGPFSLGETRLEIPGRE